MMKLRKRFILWFIAAFLLLAAAAFYLYPTLTCPDGEYDLVGTEWTLTSLNGKIPIKQVDSGTLSLAFRQTQAVGHGGCAHLIFDYILDGSKIDLIGPDFRYIACPEPINSQENEYVRSLRRVTCMQQTDSQLILSGPGAKLIYYRNPAIE